MSHNKNDQETFRDYLLGSLAGEDLEGFEERLLTEDEEFEELLASAEDELFDQYVAGHLTKDERIAFEKQFLITTERREDVDFARTLNRFIKYQTQPKPRPVPPGYMTWILRVAVAVLVVGFVAVPVYRLTRSPQNIATITLSPTVLTRGEGPPFTKVNLGNVDTLRLVLTLPEQAPSASQYRAELENGKTQSVNIEEQNSQAVTVEIPATELRKGQYALKLFAVPTGQVEQRILGNYFFTVE